jgi:hypothetical protein
MRSVGENGSKESKEKAASGLETTTYSPTQFKLRNKSKREKNE